MTDLAIVSYQKFSLTFAVEDIGREDKPFTYDMEVAALVCLAEGQRKKPGLLGGPQEKVSSVSKMHYPLWAVPSGDRCLILDGLGFSSYRDQYPRPPDIKLFIEDLRRNSSSREGFLSTVKEHAGTFKSFVSTVDVSLNAAVGKRSLLSALLEQIKQGAPFTENTEPIIIPLELNREAALESCEKFVQLWRQVQADIKGFQYALNTLEEETKLHERGILCEIEHLREKYTDEISRIKPTVEQKVRNLMRKREAEIAKITKSAEKRLRAADKEKERYENKLHILEREMILLQEKADSSKRKRDESRAARWNYELKRCRREIDGIKGEIKATSRQIEHTRKESEDTVKEIEERYRRVVEQEEAKITDLMALQGSEIEARQRESEEITSGSSRIRNLIEELIEQKKLHASKLEQEATIPWKRDEITLVHAPFYLVRYEKEAEVRYRVHPPVVAMDYKGVLRTVEKAIRSFSLESRINLLLHPKSRELGELLSSAFIGKIREDKAFEQKIFGICCSANLFNSTDFKEALTKGIKELADEGWVNPKETSTIVREYGGI